MINYIYSREYGQLEFSTRLPAHFGSGTFDDASQQIVRRLQLAQI